MQVVEIMLLVIALSTIIVNIIPNKFHKTIISISTVLIILDIIAFILISF